MAEFNLNDLEKISKSEEILDLLVNEGIIKEKKFLKQLAYEKELKELQLEMHSLQEHIIQKKERLLVIYEGRDAAGKGGTIKRTIAQLNPKLYHVIALPKPTELETKQWYFQRYFQQLPVKGEIAFFDRSWYNRAVVEPVFGFCKPEEHQLFMEQVNEIEHLLIDEGIHLVKFFLNISKEEQIDRLEERRSNPLKHYKLGGLYVHATEKWDDYSHYINKMLDQTATQKSPWIEIKTDDKHTARLESMKYIINSYPGFKPKTKLKNSKKIVKEHQGLAF